MSGGDFPGILPAIEDATEEAALDGLVVLLAIIARALPMLPALVADIDLPNVEDEVVDFVADFSW